MKLPLNVDVLTDEPDWSELWSVGLNSAPRAENHREICALLGSARDAATIRTIREIIPAKKFESYQPDVLERRSKSRIQRIANLLPDLVGGNAPLRMLDLGSGRGEFPRFFVRERANLTAIGLDIESKLFEEKKKQDPSYEQLLFLEAPAESIPIPDQSVDLVTGYNSMEHFDDPRAVLDECYRVLRPGGVMYFHFGPPWNSPFGPHLHPQFPLPYFHHLFDEDAVREALGIKRPDPYQGKNRWSLASFDDLFLRHADAECVAYKYELSWEHLWLPRELPESFAEIEPRELVVRAIEVACRRPGKWRPITKRHEGKSLRLEATANSGTTESVEFELSTALSVPTLVDVELTATGPLHCAKLDVRVNGRVAVERDPIPESTRLTVALPGAGHTAVKLTATTTTSTSGPIEIALLQNVRTNV